MDEEGLQDTENKLIHIGKPINIINKEDFFTNLEELKKEAYSEVGNIRPVIKKIAPTYRPKDI